MPDFQLPTDVLCLCRDRDTKDAVTGHALFCPQHKALIAELYKPQPRDVIMDGNQPQAPAAALPSINWRVITTHSVRQFYAPHCNVNENGVLAVGGPGEVLAIFAAGEWSAIENMDAIGADGVARVRAE